MASIDLQNLVRDEKIDQLTPSQELAIDKIKKFYRSDEKYIVVGGCAGCIDGNTVIKVRKISDKKTPIKKIT